MDELLLHVPLCYCQMLKGCAESSDKYRQNSKTMVWAGQLSPTLRLSAYQLLVEAHLGEVLLKHLAVHVHALLSNIEVPVHLRIHTLTPCRSELTACGTLQPEKAMILLSVKHLRALWCLVVPKVQSTHLDYSAALITQKLLCAAGC